MLLTISIEESYKQISPIVYEKIEEFEDKISGYFFNVHSLTKSTRNKIFEQFHEKYPEDEKIRVLESDGNPVAVIENLVLNGVDLFEARYPIDLVDKNLAIGFETEMPEGWVNEESKEGLTQERLIGFEKQPKTIDLLDKKYRKDSSLLTEGCEDPIWKSINRAYVHHLLDCKEMNASIFLTLHNLHVYQKFFIQIREHLEQGTLLEYADWFLTTQCE